MFQDAQGAGDAFDVDSESSGDLFWLNSRAGEGEDSSGEERGFSSEELGEGDLVGGAVLFAQGAEVLVDGFAPGAEVFGDLGGFEAGEPAG